MMRFVLVFTLMASSFALPPHHEPTNPRPHEPPKPHKSGDRVWDLVNATFEYARALYAKIDPQMPDVSFSSSKGIWSNLIKADGKLTNVTQEGVAYTLMNDLKTDPQNLTAQFLWIFPQIVISGNYEIDGEAASQEVHGGGRFELYTLLYYTYFNNIQLFETENKALRVKSLGLSKYIQGFAFRVHGLTVEDMGLSAFMALMETELGKRWDAYKTEYSQQQETEFITMFNDAIGNRTLEEVVQWLKEHKDDKDTKTSNFLSKWSPLPQLT